jgi:hypothetical protein
MTRLVGRLGTHRLALGLLLLRLAVAAVTIASSARTGVLEIGAALLLMAGAWTTVFGTILMGANAWDVAAGTGGVASALVVAITAALTLTGPGRLSVDDQWRGWHRLEIPPRADPRVPGR